MAGKVRFLEKELKNRCRTGDHPAVVEAVDILLANAQLKYNQTTEDHRYTQGVLHALENVRDLINKQ